jgi:hypothetical protein
MSIVVVPAVPPRPGLALPALADSTPLSAEQAADLYRATLRDVCVAAERSGGDLLVNYLPDDLLAAEHRREESAQAAVRAALAPALDDPDDARFEEQVGSSLAARVGNTVTHLLEREDATSVQVLDPTAATVGRSGIDGAAMKLRRHEVVLGPAPGGRVYVACFTEPVDFAGATAAPAVQTLTDRAGDAGLSVDFVEYGPVVHDGDDLASLTALLRSRETAGRRVPEHTAAFLDEAGIVVGEDGLATDSL